jgi:cytochrome P450
MTLPVSAGASPASITIERLRPSGLGERFMDFLLDRPWLWMAALRTLPILYVGSKRLNIVARFDHVQEVLSRDQVFQVPFVTRMMKLMPGPPFVLAMQDGLEYQQQRRQLMDVFRLEDLAGTVAPRSAVLAEEIVERSGGRLDAIEELLAYVPTQLCGEYYGIDVQEPKQFAQWTMVMSKYVFGPPWSNGGLGADLARDAANCLRPLLDDAISKAHGATDRSKTIVGRLVDLQRRNGSPSDAMIRAELFGMVLGFVPTNTIASGNMLEVLLRRPAFMEQARAAACAGDDHRLWQCLMEALRFKPISPGCFRKCVTDYTIAEGGFRAKRIMADTWVLASTQSAMFDSRHVTKPRAFRPDRRAHESMVFGYGLHWCIGAYFAAAQITQTFGPLLKKRGLRRAWGREGQMRAVGRFPTHLVVEFTP